jgi:hypothetical protein
MKQKIYTIPVTDALKAGGECPFCLMKKSLEKEAIDFVTGPSYMERDTRAETDKVGFCGEHLEKMFQAQNALGLALMLQTRLMRINKEIKTAAHEKQKKKENHPIVKLIKSYDKCYVCNRINSLFSLYIETFLDLWQEEEIRTLTEQGQGFCLSHFCSLLEKAQSYLPAKQFPDFAEAVIKIQIRNLDRFEEEIDWFTKKFDYRFSDEPWKNSKDSLQRTILKISSKEVNEPIIN